jgi:hypothetical protein
LIADGVGIFLDSVRYRQHPRDIAPRAQSDGASPRQKQGDVASQKSSPGVHARLLC